MNIEIFNTDNFEKLMRTCNQIIAISSENVDGQLMASQLLMLGEKIKDFIENPIVDSSGIIQIGEHIE